MSSRILFLLLVLCLGIYFFADKVLPYNETKIAEPESIDHLPSDPIVNPVDRSQNKLNKDVGNNQDEVTFDISSSAFTGHVTDIQEMDHVLGAKNADVVFIEYSSPTCPHCSFFHKNVLPKLKEKYIDTNKITYVLREFITNKQDLDSSILGRCYKNDEDPLKLLNLFYIQQESWAFSKKYREILTNMGSLAGVSPEKYNECLNDKKMIEFLVNNAKIVGEHPDFIGTPAFFINGKIYKDAYSLEALSDAIDSALREVKSSDAQTSKTKNQES